MTEGHVRAAAADFGRVVTRPRLIRALDHAPGRVVVLRAPAGFGKTTLARQWADSRRISFWYRANSASADVAALALELGQLLARDADKLLPLTSSVAATTGSQTDAYRLADLLVSCAVNEEQDCWLVIDDYQFIASSAASDAFFERLVDLERINLLVASRVLPTWATPRRLLYGKILELNQSALAMTPDEAAAVLASPSPERNQELIATARGWPAVIGLAARATDPAAAVHDQLPETLHRFFAEELFREMAPDVRRDLIKLSIEPRITEVLLTELFPESHVSFVAEASKAGFLARNGEELEIHPLLRDFLVSKLSTLPALAVKSFGEMLVGRHLSLGELDEGFAVAERLQTPDLLTRILEVGMEPLLARGRLPTLDHWIATARKADVDSPLVDLAEAEIDFRTGKVARAFARASQVASILSEGHPLLGRALFRAGQSAHLDDRAQDAVELLQKSYDAARTPRERHRALWSTLLVQTEMERLDQAEATLGLLEQERPSASEDQVRLAQARLLLALRRGGLQEALPAAETVYHLLVEGLDPVVLTGFLHTLAHAYGLSALYDEAVHASDENLAHADRLGLDFVLPHALCTRAVANLGLRRFSEALRDVERAFDRANAASDVHSEMNSLSIAAKIYLCQQEPERAISVLSGTWERPPAPGMSGDFFAVQSLAFACSLDWDNAEAAVLRSEQVSALSEGRVLRSLVRALVAYGRREPNAGNAIRKSLVDVTTSGNLDAFVLAYRAYPDLLNWLGDVSSEERVVAVRTLQRVDPAVAERAGFGGLRPRVRTNKKLTRREQEVLTLIRQGFSNKQIAASLWISEPTAKLHVHHILEKLGVRSRTEAALASIDD